MVLVTIFLLSSPATGIILEDIDGRYISNVSQLPPPPEIQPDLNNTKTTMIVDNQGHPVLWLYSSINISGFYPSARIEGVDYVISLNSTIVSSRTLYKFDRDWCKECYINNMTNETSVKILNNTVFAYLNITVNWTSVHWVWCGDGCWYRIDAPHVSHQNISDNRSAPEIFVFPTNESIRIERYNTRNILTFDDFNESITSYIVTTENGTIERVLRVGTVDYTENGIPFMNVTDFELWKSTGTGIYHQMNDVIMENTTNFTILYDTPFGQANITTNYSVIQMRQSEIKGFVFQLFYIVGVFFLGIYIMHRVTL